jgi:hypothetical protein
MTRIIDTEHVEPVVRAMVGAATVEDGPTAEQLAVIGALARTYFGADLDPATIAPLGPHEVAASFDDPAPRRRVRELLVLVELCRHPESAAQVARVDDYAAALGESGPGLQLARDLVTGGVATASADYMRFFADLTGPLLEPQLAKRYGVPLEQPAPELVDRLRSFTDLPDGTLGRAYLDFYARYGFEIPGEDLSTPAVFVSHDMCHVIGGYEPIGVEEIALGAMQLGMTDSDAHWMQFMGNLGVHESGYLDGGGKLVPKEGTLGRPGAAETVAHAFWRGARTTTDFTTVDHLALADQPLEDVRASFGIPPRDC